MNLRNNERATEVGGVMGLQACGGAVIFEIENVQILPSMILKSLSKQFSCVFIVCTQQRLIAQETVKGELLQLSHRDRDLCDA